MERSPPDQSQLDALAESFAQRYRNGECPSVSEYTAKYPDLASEIQELFPALVMMEQVDRDLQDGDRQAVNASETRSPISQLGDFRIVREIGRGGMGVVYEAEQLSLGRRVALKVLPQQALFDPLYRQRFIREAKAAAKLHHTNIVPVFGVGEQDGIHYYVMQFINGLGLDEVLVELKRLRHESKAHRLQGKPPAKQSGVQDAGAAGSQRSGDQENAQSSLSANSVARSLMSGHFDLTVIAIGDVASDSLFNGKPEPVKTAESPAVPRTKLATDTVSRRQDFTKSLSGAFALSGGDRNQTAAQSRSIFYHSVARIGAQAASALQYAHDHGIVHRDIKPGNLLLDSAGDVWVTDFGLAKAEDQQDLTKTGDILGTLRYMAPEQLEGTSSALSDVYSLGLTLYELLVLQPAFDERDRHRLIRQVVDGTPARLATIDPELPRDLETIIQKAIDRDPVHRYQSAGELDDDLQRFLSDEPIRAVRISLAARFQRWCRRNPVVAILACVITLLLVSGTIASGMAAVEFSNLAQTRNDALEAEQAAREDALRGLFDSLLSEARASRWSRRSGQRTKAEAAIAKAAALLDDLKLSEDLRDELRNEVVAAMSLADIQCIDTWGDLPSTNTQVHFSTDFHRCAMIEYDRNQITIVSLRNLSVPELQVTIPSETSRAELSPDFNWTVTYDAKRTSLRSVNSGHRIATFSTAYYNGNDFSADGHYFASGDSSGTVTVFDLKTREVVLKHAPGRGPVKRVKFSPDGKTIAVADDRSGIIQIRDVLTGDMIREFVPAQNKEIWSIAWDPKGRWLAAGYRRQINVWDLRQPTRESVLMSGHETAVDQLEFHADGNLLGSRSWDGTSRIWEAATGFELLRLSSQFRGFSHDGRHLFTRDGLTVSKWEVILPSGIDWIYSNQPTYVVDVDASGRILALGFDDGVRLFDVIENRQLAFLPLGTTQSLMFHPVNGSLVTASTSGLHAWPVTWQQSDSESGVTIGPPKHFDKRLTAAGYVDVDIGQHGTLLAQTKRRAHPDLAYRSNIEAVPLRRDDARWISLSTDGAWAACGAWGKSTGVVVWDTKSAQEILSIPTKGNARPIFSNDDRWLAVNSGDAVSFYEAGTWRLVHRYPSGSIIPPDVVFSHDCSLAAMGRRGSGLDLVDLRDGRLRVRLSTNQQHPDYDSLCITHGNTHLAASRGEAGACVWDLRTIRDRLRQIGLDWSQEPIPESPDQQRTINLSIDLGAIAGEGRRRECRSLLRQQKWEVAIQAADLALQAYAKDAAALRMRAQAKIALGQFEDAVADYKQSLQFAEADARMCNALAWQIVGTGLPDEPRLLQAVEWAEQANTLDPGNAAILNTLGIACYRLKRWDETIAFLEKAEMAEPRKYFAHNGFFIAMAHWQLGNHAEARNLFEMYSAWMDGQMPNDAELKRYRAEANKLLAQELPDKPASQE